MKNFSRFLSMILFVAAVFSISCKNDKIGSVEREDLFSLDIGPMEDQIALFKLDGGRGIKRTGFTMRDGLFFIADGNSGKIVRYNSYGDLLFMIYNDETNPAPITLKTNIQEDEQATRWAYTYPLEEPGWIAVDSRKHIFVEDRLQQQDQRTDQETKVVLDGIILHFDQNGRFVNYLGKEGIGGSPFPRIVGMSTSIRDELVVICRLPGGWDVYWFSPAGMLLYLVKISSSVVLTLNDWPEALSLIDSITAAPDARKLYIKVDYSHDKFDQLTNTRTGSEPISSCLWTLNVEDGTYLGSVEIPLYEVTENGRPSGVKVFYSILGAARNGQALFYFPVETGYSLLFVNTDNKEQRRGYIQFSMDELRYNDFYLSTEGILSAMLADNFKVKLVWWRTDKLFGESL
ncbi:LIC_12708 family protein [Treponema sp. R8-4-B8]